MSRCLCTHSRDTVTIGDWEDCPLENGGYTTFGIMRCLTCGGITGFPNSNLDIALDGGTEKTKTQLNAIIADKKRSVSKSTNLLCGVASSVSAMSIERDQWRKQRNQTINHDTLLMSLLYDLDLLPEQVEKGSRDECCLDSVCVHWMRVQEKERQTK